MMSVVQSARSMTAKVANKARWEWHNRRCSKPKTRLIHQRIVDGDAETVTVCAEPSFIDPLTGFVVTHRGVLVEASMTPNFRYHKPQWRLGLPDHQTWFQRVSGDGATVVHHDRVVSIRHHWEWNYYHFWIDVLGKLQLLDLVGIADAEPLVLGPYVNDVGYARPSITSGSLGDRNWIIPDHMGSPIVSADEVVYCQTRQPYKARVEYLLERLEIPRDTRSDERVFLTRRRPVGRVVLNEDELQPVLDRYSFRTIDASALGLRERMEVFARTRHLVAAHGAGIVNVMFRGARPLGVLELHGSSYAGPGDMTRLCQELGYCHDSLAGQSNSRRFASESSRMAADYRVDPRALEASIRRMLVVG
jgi:capsular polysaccharide biosynthesis protein